VRRYDSGGAAMTPAPGIAAGHPWRDRAAAVGSALQAAYNLGAPPDYRVDPSERDRVRTEVFFGASIGINASREDAVARILEIHAGGADFVFDAIGLGKTTEQMLGRRGPV